MKKYRIAAAAAAAVLCLGLLAGCARELPDASSGEGGAVSSQPEPTTAEKFDQFCEEVFRFALSQDALSLQYTVAHPENYGLEEVPASWGSFVPTPETVDKTKSFLTELKTFAYSELTDDQKLTYDTLLTGFEQSAGGEAFPLYEEALSATVGLQAQMPSLLAEYALRSKQDVERYLLLLKDTERYFGEILAYEKEKSEAGLFMADFAVDAIVAQCESFLRNPDENMLITSFAGRLEQAELTDEEKANFTSQNEEAVKGPFLSAYRTLSEGLKALKGTGKNPGGLCGLEKGKEFYAYMVAQSTGSSRSIDDIRDRLQRDLDAHMQTLENLTQEDVAAWQLYKPALTEPEDMLKDMQRKLQMDFPEPPPVSYTVKKVDEALADYVSPAFYLIPPLDDFQNNVIYINETYSESMDLYTTLVHEGYPGHLYQSVFFLSQNPAPVRSVLSYSGYVEGWATYVECEYGYAYSGRPEPAVRIERADRLAALETMAIVDIGVNYDGWDVSETLEFLKTVYGDSIDRNGAEAFFQSIVEEPGNVLPYVVGNLEFLQLKAAAKERLDEAFDVKEFHRLILETGPVPFSLLEKQMNMWMDGLTAGENSALAAA